MGTISGARGLTEATSSAALPPTAPADGPHRIRRASTRTRRACRQAWRSGDSADRRTHPRTPPRGRDRRHCASRADCEARLRRWRKNFRGLLSTGLNWVIRIRNSSLICCRERSTSITPATTTLTIWPKLRASSGVTAARSKPAPSKTAPKSATPVSPCAGGRDAGCRPASGVGTAIEETGTADAAPVSTTTGGGVSPCGATIGGTAEGEAVAIDRGDCLHPPSDGSSRAPGLVVAADVDPAA